MDTPNSITKTDLQRIEASLKKVLDATRKGQIDKQHVDLLNQLIETVNQLRITVEFDHEKRLSAIEEFLQEL